MLKKIFWLKNVRSKSKFCLKCDESKNPKAENFEKNSIQPVIDLLLYSHEDHLIEKILMGPSFIMGYNLFLFYFYCNNSLKRYHKQF